MSIYEAKTQLSRLVDRAAGGKEIIISRNGAPVAPTCPLSNRPNSSPTWVMRCRSASAGAGDHVGAMSGLTGSTR